MTLNEWAEVLSGIADAGERRDCLLVLADDLRNETGAEVLRGLARRDDGLSPEDMWDRWDWNAADVGFGGNILPEELIIGMASTRNDAGEFPPPSIPRLLRTGPVLARPAGSPGLLRGDER